MLRIRRCATAELLAAVSHSPIRQQSSQPVLCVSAPKSLQDRSGVSAEFRQTNCLPDLTPHRSMTTKLFCGWSFHCQRHHGSTHLKNWRDVRMMRPLSGSHSPFGRLREKFENVVSYFVALSHGHAGSARRRHAWLESNFTHFRARSGKPNVSLLSVWHRLAVLNIRLTIGSMRPAYFWAEP